ncbi:MAG: hypothetical protein HY673_07310 [Chloroflexi bacterium]|nr:hypothetical protein [Chloroflexota bacterium]
MTEQELDQGREEGLRRYQIIAPLLEDESRYYVNPFPGHCQILQTRMWLLILATRRVLKKPCFVHLPL